MLFPEMLLRIQDTLKINQRQLAELLGCSSRTVIRYYRGGGTLLPATYERLAVTCHPRDRELAVFLAARAGRTLVQLGLEAPPPPPAPPTPPRPVASPRHLVDSVVCAAAEAMQTTPQAMRPALVSAFERALAVGMSADEVLQALTVAAPATKAGKTKPPPALT